MIEKLIDSTLEFTVLAAWFGGFWLVLIGLAYFYVWLTMERGE